MQFYVSLDKWATTWQNQQNECAPSEDSDQPGHPHSSCGQQRLHADSGCPGWSLSSLGAQPHCWFCHVAAHICFPIPLARTEIKIITPDPVLTWLLHSYNHIPFTCDHLIHTATSLSHMTNQYTLPHPCLQVSIPFPCDHPLSRMMLFTHQLSLFTCGQPVYMSTPLFKYGHPIHVTTPFTHNMFTRVHPVHMTTSRSKVTKPIHTSPPHLYLTRSHVTGRPGLLYFLHG